VGTVVTMTFSREQKNNALAYCIAFRAKLVARLAAVEEGRYEDALPPSGRATYWAMVDAKTLRDVIGFIDERIEAWRNINCID
jgi:hypothetical protein